MMNYVSENQKPVMHQWLLENRRFGSSFECKYYETRMHSSRMRTARSLTVSAYLVVSDARPPQSNHACPLGATTHAAPPPRRNHTPPPNNHACPPGATMHAPRSNHTCPPWSNHAPPPGATMHAPL